MLANIARSGVEAAADSVRIAHGGARSVALYGKSSGVVDLAATGRLPWFISAQADLRTTAAAMVGLLLSSASESLIGTDFVTAAQGLGFTNQPASDSVTVRSNSASDVGLVVTIYGTTVSTDYISVGVATIAAKDTDYDFRLPDGTAKANWGKVVGVSLSRACVGTVTLKEKSGGLTIVALSAAATGSGIVAVAAAADECYDLPISAVKTGVTTESLGVIGTDCFGNTIYDSVSLSSNTPKSGLVGFRKISNVLVGDVRGSEMVTVELSGLTYGAAGATLLHLGDLGPYRIASPFRYLHWCLYTGVAATVGGVADRLLLQGMW